MPLEVLLPPPLEEVLAEVGAPLEEVLAEVGASRGETAYVYCNCNARVVLVLVVAIVYMETVNNLT